MGSIDGFIKRSRTLPDHRPVGQRVNDYFELYEPHSDKLTVGQASRCMDCGIPFCHSGCPLGNFIPDFNDAVYHENWEKAVELLLTTNNFPEFTGRICPAPCEGSCVLGINKPPVAIELIEKSIIEKGFELGIITPKPPSKRLSQAIAVIGSGPAGLAAADQLNKSGYHVTVYERDPKPGGLLRFGIPDFKLDKHIVERRVRLMEEEGIKFICNCHVGFDITAMDLNTYDAVLLTGGSTIPRDLPIPGRELEGVHFAMDFLTQQNRRVSKLPETKEEIWATGKNVVVIGGGDTGSDCIGTSNRQKAKSVLQFEIMERPPRSRSWKNPWPEYPAILRTSTSHEEGVERDWSIMSKEFVGKNGKVEGLKTVKVKWTDAGPKEILGSETIHPCDLALLAIGFVHPQKEGIIAQLGVELDNRGNVAAVNYATSVKGIFTAGDMRRGQSLVVWAISEGREAAREVDKYLMKEETALPSKDLSEYRV